LPQTKSPDRMVGAFCFSAASIHLAG